MKGLLPTTASTGALMVPLCQVIFFYYNNRVVNSPFLFERTIKLIFFLYFFVFSLKF